MKFRTKKIWFFKLHFRQLFSADSTILKKKICHPKHKNPASKVANNPTRPRVLTPASIWLCGTETVLAVF